MITLAAITVGGVTAAILSRLFFTSFGEFLDSLRLYFTPEIISAFRGEWRESNWAYVKVLIYFGLVIGSGFMTRYSLVQLFS